jgi:hypothetical protein
MVRFDIPVQTVSEANTRQHWAVRANRVKQHRNAARLMMDTHRPERLWESLRIKLTRISPRLIDSDNAVGSMKAVRDGIADALGISDADPRVTWEYGQEKGKPPAVRVDIE